MAILFLLIGALVSVGIIVGIVMMISHDVNEDRERRNMMNYQNPNMGAQPFQQPFQPVQNAMADPAEAPVVPEAPPVDETAETEAQENVVPEQPFGQPEPFNGGFSATPPEMLRAATAKAPKEKLSASSVMLLIGTIFVILAALTFIVANWVKFEPLGRVGALAGAGALAFGISALFKKVVDLDRTSGAFYVIGTLFASFSFLTAGFYDLFGSWLSVGGGGAALLYCILLVIIAAAMFLAYPIYKNEAYRYFGTADVSMAIFALCVQFTPNFAGLAFTVTALSAVYLAAIHVFGIHKGTALEKPIKITADVSSVLYSTVGMIYAFSELYHPSGWALGILAVIMVQLAYYAHFKGMRALYILLNLIAIYTTLSAATFFEDEYGIFAFSVGMLVIYLFDRFLPRVHTFSKAFTFIVLWISSLVCVAALTSSDCYFILIVPAIVTIFQTELALSKRKGVQIIAGIASPVVPLAVYLLLTDAVGGRYDVEWQHNMTALCTDGLAAVYLIVSAFFIFLPKISFRLHAKCPNRVKVIEYMNMAAAALALCGVSHYNDLFVVALGLSILHIIISNNMKVNFTGAISTVALMIQCCNLTDHLTISPNNGLENTTALTIVMLVLFVIAMAVSRFIFGEGIIIKNEQKITLDITLLTSWLLILGLPDTDFRTFIRWILLAVYAACFIKKNTSETAAAVILSISAAMAVFAVLTREFLIPSDDAINSKITLAVIFLLGLAYRFIWRKAPTTAKTISTIIYIFSFIGLQIDGFRFSGAANKIFVLAVTAGVLVWSFFGKSKTWFSVSSVALVVITVFSTIRYFDKAGWWIFLLAVGVIFIVIATINEMCKKKGESIKSTVFSKFSDWTW